MRISKKIQLFLCTGLVSILTLASCQQDENPQQTVNTETLSQASPLTGLLERVAMSDTASDNVVDSTSCFQVDIPFQVLVNDQLVTVSTAADLATVESYFGGTVTGLDTIEFVFPITVIFPDYTETVITNQQQYDALLADCDDTAVPGDQGPIGCISIVYPIELFVYNSDFQLADTVTINNDQQLFSFLANLTPVQYFAISYPFSIINTDGETVTIYNNAESVSFIQAAIPLCAATVDPVEGCEVQNTPFSQIYNTALGLPDVMDGTIWSAETHEYTFSVSTDGTICSIGYQADQGFPDEVYVMSICDENGNVLYSGTHSFSDIATSYAAIPPVAVTANVQYTIKRFKPTGGGLCRVATKVSGMDPILPLTADNVTIYHSKYYGAGTGSDLPNQYLIPYIDFSFTPN